MSRALIAYSTRKGATERIAACIAEGLTAAGVDVQVKQCDEIASEVAIEGFDALVIGSATYHGEMMQTSKQMLFLADKVNLKGKVGAAFGAYGWSGEAPIRIFETMRHILGMDMVAEPLRLKSAALEEHCEDARAYGREVAAKLEKQEPATELRL